MSEHPAAQLPWAPHPASSLETPFILNLPEEGFVAVHADGTTTPLPAQGDEAVICGDEKEVTDA